MMNSPKWPQNKYYGKSKQEIKDLWKQTEQKLQKWEQQCTQCLNIITITLNQKSLIPIMVQKNMNIL